MTFASNVYFRRTKVAGITPKVSLTSPAASWYNRVNSETERYENYLPSNGIESTFGRCPDLEASVLTTTQDSLY